MEEELINKKDIRKKRNILTLSILSTIIILLGSSYAFFTYFKSANAFVLTSNSITATFTEGTNQISFTNAYPISDEFALQNLDKLDYIDFTVSGNATNSKEAITYEIFLTEDTSNTLDKNYIKTYVTDENGGKVTDPAIYGSLPQTTYGNEPTGKVVLKKTYKGEFTKSYRLYIWLDKDYEQNTVSQTFSFYVNIYAYNDKSENAEVGISAQELINNMKTNNLKDNNGTPVNYVTETNNGDTITYLSGCSKYYLDQGAERCSVDNTIDFNYVWYSGRMWRITSFNETTNIIKLITQDAQTAIAWHDSSSAFEGSYVKQFLNDEFYDTLYQPNIFVDTSVKWDVTTTTRVSTKLSNPTVTSNVGLLNSYEYYQSYRKANNSYGYLKIGQWWWLLNPSRASIVWRVSSNGDAGNGSLTEAYAARPSINLLSTVKFIGNGTESDPYKLVGDMSVGKENDNLNTRQVGEYVKLKNGANEQVFRIVSFENNTTKLIALDYADSGNNKKFATANSSGNGTIFEEGNTVDDTNNTTWYSYLKNVYISDLKTKYGSNMFTSGEYYLGINADNPSDTTVNYNYRTSICASTADLTKNCTKSRSKTLEAGLLRYGEMFAAQLGIGYNPKASTYNTKHMWLMTRRTASGVWDVDSYGRAWFSSPPTALAARPSINLSSGVKIFSGSGTELDPYLVYIGELNKNGDYTINLDKGNGDTSGTEKIKVSVYDNWSIIDPSVITLPLRELSYNISGFSLDSSRKSNDATVSGNTNITSNSIVTGFYTSSTGGEKVLNGNTNASFVLNNVSGYLTNGNWVGGNDKTLYAQYSMKPVTLPKITKRGFTCGWSESSTETTITYDSGQSNFISNGNTTLYGVCNVNAISNVNLNLEQSTINVGEETYLDVWFDGEAATISISSSDTSVAEVNDNYIYGVGSGTATITVTLTDYEGTVTTETLDIEVGNVCPNCVFAYPSDVWYTNWNENEQTFIPEYERENYGIYPNYNDLVEETGRNFFVGLKFDDGDYIEEAYTCAIIDEELICIEGYNGSEDEYLADEKYQRNLEFTQPIFENYYCDSNENLAWCHNIDIPSGEFNNINMNFDKNGHADFGSCYIESKGELSCNEEIRNIKFTAVGSRSINVGDQLETKLSYYGLAFGVSYSSSDTSVAEVSPDGLIIGYAQGLATITVTIYDSNGEFTSTLEIGVGVELENDETLSEMCPNCRFMFTTNQYQYNEDGESGTVLDDIINNDNVLVSTNYEDIINDSGHAVFLGVITNNGTTSGKITRAFACGLEPDSNTPFCIEGYTDGSKQERNIAFMKPIFGEENCSNEYCESASGSIYAYSSLSLGVVEVYYSNSGYPRCSVGIYGNMGCDG